MADNDNNNDQQQQRHVARMIVRDETSRSDYILPPPKPSRPSQEGGEERKSRTEVVERSNSRVTARVSNLMRWPRTNKAGGEKEQGGGGGGQMQQTKNSFLWDLQDLHITLLMPWHSTVVGPYCVHRNQIHVVRDSQRGAVSDDLRMNIQIVRPGGRRRGAQEQSRS